MIKLLLNKGNNMPQFTINNKKKMQNCILLIVDTGT